MGKASFGEEIDTALVSWAALQGSAVQTPATSSNDLELGQSLQVKGLVLPQARPQATCTSDKLATNLGVLTNPSVLIIYSNGSERNA